MEIAELKARMAALGTTDGPPPPRHTWARHRFEIRRHCQRSDAQMLFLKWSTLAETMFVGEAPYIADELKALQDARDWKRWANAIAEPGAGAPVRLSFYPASSGNLVHQAYHLKLWEDATGYKVNGMRCIAEFGGGYGAMALVCRRLGFEGEYHIYDLPEVSLLQEHYLGQCGVGATLYQCDETPLPMPPHADLAVACWSLSEIPINARAKFLEGGQPASYLFAYQTTWLGMDNWTYFNAFAETHDEYVWFRRLACRGSRYLFGRRRGWQER